MKTLIQTLLVVLALLMFSRPAATETLRIGKNLRNENVLLPASIPDKSRIISESLMVQDKDGVAGILVFYDDFRTRLEFDYIEFYDVIGNLLVVSWIDGFGICQIAIDRGLLDKEEPSIERVLVLITGGTAL